MRHCILCGSVNIFKVTEGRFTHAICHDCDSEWEFEADPPDARGVRGRIEVMSRRVGKDRFGTGLDAPRQPRTDNCTDTTTE